ncbi:actin-related protein 6-like [Sycon ciliatum]|uniref:actin-related protein 6-like n=1 Tax=Sycon ciliatum TaxID=27933 RepID=UPI0031F6A62D
MEEKKVVVLDNGGYTAKIGLASSDLPRVVPNCMTKAKAERRRTFVGAELDECKDKSGLYYVSAFQKGYMTNWDIEHVIWDYMFSKNCLKIKPESCHLALTEPVFNFPCIQEALDEIIFEDYRFQSLVRHWGPVYSAYSYSQQACATVACSSSDSNDTGNGSSTGSNSSSSGSSCTRAASSSRATLCSLVVDVGHSFTHVLPFIQGKVISSAVLRIDVGGKVLTNYLKDVTSYRQLNVMDETYVVNQMKEDCCFVSQDLVQDMGIAKLRGKGNTIVGDYALPDFQVLHRGAFKKRASTATPDGESSQAVDEQLQSIVLNNERFSVPELLFHPSDIGIDQMGVCEAIVHAISRTPIALHPHFYQNILVTGGSASFPGMQGRMYRELRMLAPVDYKVVVSVAENPTLHCWKSAAEFATNEEHAAKFTVTREEYEEHGRAVCQQRFRHESSL